MNYKLYTILTVTLLLLAACNGGQSQHMRDELAVLQAMNQADSVLTDDSLAQALADWFDRHGTPNEQMEAHYLLGRTHADRGEAPAALAAYHDAIDRADTTAADCNYRQLCRVYAQMAKVFYQQSLIKDQLDCLNKSMEIGLKGKDTIAVIDTYAHKISSYEILGKHDSVIFIGNQLYTLYEKGYRKLASRYFAAVIPSLLEKEQIMRAKQFIDIYEQESGYFDSLGNVAKGREAYYNCKGRYYMAICRFDSAEHFFRREFSECKDFINKNMASKDLSRLFVLKKEPDSAAKYALIAYAMNDSVYSNMVSAEVEKVNSMYNYTHHKELAIKEKERAELENAHFRYLAYIFVVVLVSGILLAWKKKKEREAEKARYEKDILALRKLHKEQETLKALAARQTRESEAEFNKIIMQKNNEMDSLKESIRRYRKRQRIMTDTAEDRLRESLLYTNIKSKLRTGKALTEEELLALDKFAKESLPNLCSFIQSKGINEGTTGHRICIMFRLHFNVKTSANLLNVKSPYISQVSTELMKILFHKEGSSKELKKEIEKFDTRQWDNLF